MIYTSLKPSVDIPSVDLHTYLFAPEFARPSDSPSNLSIVDAARLPSDSISQADVYRLSGELGAGLTKMWLQGITPIAPVHPLDLAALPYIPSEEEEKVSVAIFSPNTTSFALALLACLSSPLGIIATLASSSYHAEDLLYQLQDARAGIVLVHPSLLSVVEEALKDQAQGWRERVFILGDSLDEPRIAGFKDFSELRVGGEEGSRLRQGVRPRADDVAFLCYSSGTVSTK